VIDRRDANRPLVRRAQFLTRVAAIVLPVLAGAPAVHAQSILRTPSLNIGPRLPAITSGATARINPNIAGSVGPMAPIFAPMSAPISASG